MLVVLAVIVTRWLPGVSLSGYFKVLISGLASADASARRQSWKELMWPAATVTPPVFIGLANAQEVAGLIGATQVAARTPANK